MPQQLNGFIQLPNGDLWGGSKIRPDAPAAASFESDPVPAANAADAVMEMFASQKGELMSCVWCGQQFSRKQLNEFVEHVESLHKGALGANAADEAALAALAFADAKLAAAPVAKPIAAPSKPSK